VRDRSADLPFFAICTGAADEACTWSFEDRREMAPRYTVSTEIEFSSSHALDGYDGDCARLHGHNWVLRVYYEFTRLDEQGIAVDYCVLAARVKETVLPLLDHRHLNDLPLFEGINPTSENIAAAIFSLLREKVRFEGGGLSMIELWETPTDMVRYSDE
jgi:6-pyruvoyltetrahydropterin/6-carboxytetrahydropterin synthase